MMKLHEILGVQESATQAEIRKAYLRLSRKHHPDKVGGGDSRKYLEIKEAYETLTDEKKLREYEASSEDGEFHFLTAGSKQRPSEKFSAKFQLFQAIFEAVPLEGREESSKKELFGEFSAVFEKLPEDYHALYCDGKQSFSDIYTFIAHKNEAGHRSRPFTIKSWSVPSALTFFQQFLSGKLFGRALGENNKSLNKYCQSLEQKKAPMARFFRSVLKLTEATKTNHDEVHQSLTYIFQYLRQYPDIDKGMLTTLYGDLTFRAFVLFASHQFWMSQTSSTDLTMLLDALANSKTNLKPSVMVKILKLLERDIRNVLRDGILEEESDPEIQAQVPDEYELRLAILEQAKKQIDLAHCDVSTITKVNALLLAAQCYHLVAAEWEVWYEEEHEDQAAELMALKCYQLAIEKATNATPVLLLYVTSVAVKALSEFRFDHKKLILTAEQQKEIMYNRRIKKDFNNGDMSLTVSDASLDETILGALNRFVYLVDLVPSIMPISPYLDLFFMQKEELERVKGMLKNRADKPGIHPRERAKALYHLYEGQTRGWVDGHDEDVLRFRAMQDLLTDSGSSMGHMEAYLDELHVCMERDMDGFFMPVNCLNIPNDPENLVFSAVHGFKMDLDTGKIDFVLDRVGENAPGHMGVITQWDIQQMIEHSVSHAIFSLDHPDPNKRIDPRQKMRFKPAHLEHTEFLINLLTIDNLLKFFTTGVEVSANPPYKNRPVEYLIAHLPKHLKDIIALGQGSKGHEPVARRFWFVVNNIEARSSQEGNVYTFRMGKTDIGLETHMLKLDASGEMVDTDSEDENSDAKRFAKAFTQHYNEFAFYFPELRRFAEFMHVASIIDQLETIEKQATDKNWHNAIQALKDLGLGKLKPVEEIEAEPSYVPAAMDNGIFSAFRVYGGVCAIPKVSESKRKFDELCMDLRSASNHTNSPMFAKSDLEKTIRDAEWFKFEHSFGSGPELTLMGRIKLDGEIRDARSKLLHMETWQRFSKQPCFMPSFKSALGTDSESAIPNYVHDPDHGWMPNYNNTPADLINGRAHYSLDPDLVAARVASMSEPVRPPYQASPSSASAMPAATPCNPTPPDDNSGAESTSAFTPPVFDQGASAHSDESETASSQPTATQVPQAANFPPPPPPFCPEATPYYPFRAEKYTKKINIWQEHKPAFDLARTVLGQSSPTQMNVTNIPASVTNTNGMVSRSWSMLASILSKAESEWMFPVPMPLIDSLVVAAYHLSQSPLQNPEGAKEQSKGKQKAAPPQPSKTPSLDAIKEMLQLDGKTYDEARVRLKKSCDESHKHLTGESMSLLEEQANWAIDTAPTAFVKTEFLQHGAAVMASLLQSRHAYNPNMVFNLNSIGKDYKESDETTQCNRYWADRLYNSRIAEKLNDKIEELAFMLVGYSCPYLSIVSRLHLEGKMPSEKFVIGGAGEYRVVRAVGSMVVSNASVGRLEQGEYVSNSEVEKLTRIHEVRCHVSESGGGWGNLLEAVLEKSGITFDGKVERVTYTGAPTVLGKSLDQVLASLDYIGGTFRPIDLGDRLTPKKTIAELLPTMPHQMHGPAFQEINAYTMTKPSVDPRNPISAFMSATTSALPAVLVKHLLRIPDPEQAGKNLVAVPLGLMDTAVEVWEHPEKIPLGIAGMVFLGANAVVVLDAHLVPSHPYALLPSGDDLSLLANNTQEAEEMRAFIQAVHGDRAIYNAAKSNLMAAWQEIVKDAKAFADKPEEGKLRSATHFLAEGWLTGKFIEVAAAVPKHVRSGGRLLWERVTERGIPAVERELELATLLPDMSEVNWSRIQQRKSTLHSDSPMVLFADAPKKFSSHENRLQKMFNLEEPPRLQKPAGISSNRLDELSKLSRVPDEYLVNSSLEVCFKLDSKHFKTEGPPGASRERVALNYIVQRDGMLTLAPKQLYNDPKRAIHPSQLLERGANEEVAAAGTVYMELDPGEFRANILKITDEAEGYNNGLIGGFEAQKKLVEEAFKRLMWKDVDGKYQVGSYFPAEIQPPVAKTPKLQKIAGISPERLGELRKLEIIPEPFIFMDPIAMVNKLEAEHFTVVGAACAHKERIVLNYVVQWDGGLFLTPKHLYNKRSITTHPSQLLEGGVNEELAAAGTVHVEINYRKRRDDGAVYMETDPQKCGVKILKITDEAEGYNNGVIGDFKAQKAFVEKAFEEHGWEGTAAKYQLSDVYPTTSLKLQSKGGTLPEEAGQAVEKLHDLERLSSKYVGSTPAEVFLNFDPSHFQLNAGIESIVLHFVITKEKKLLVAPKLLKRKKNRPTHHSQLLEGGPDEPLLAAGTVYVVKEGSRSLVAKVEKITDEAPLYTNKHLGDFEAQQALIEGVFKDHNWSDAEGKYMAVQKGIGHQNSPALGQQPREGGTRSASSFLTESGITERGIGAATQLPSKVIKGAQLPLQRLKLHGLNKEGMQSVESLRKLDKLPEEYLASYTGEVALEFDHRHFNTTHDGDKIALHFVVDRNRKLILAPKYLYSEPERLTHHSQLLAGGIDEEILAAGTVYVVKKSGEIVPCIVKITAEAPGYSNQQLGSFETQKIIVEQIFVDHCWEDAVGKYVDQDIDLRGSADAGMFAYKPTKSEIALNLERFGMREAPQLHGLNNFGITYDSGKVNLHLDRKYVVSKPEEVCTQFLSHAEPTSDTSKVMILNYIITEDGRLHISPQRLKNSASDEHVEFWADNRIHHSDIFPESMINKVLVAGGQAFVEFINGKVYLRSIDDSTGHFWNKKYVLDQKVGEMVEKVFKNFGWQANGKFVRSQEALLEAAKSSKGKAEVVSKGAEDAGKLEPVASKAKSKLAVVDPRPGMFAVKGQAAEKARNMDLFGMTEKPALHMLSERGQVNQAARQNSSLAADLIVATPKAVETNLTRHAGELEGEMTLPLIYVITEDGGLYLAPQLLKSPGHVNPHMPLGTGQIFHTDILPPGAKNKVVAAGEVNIKFVEGEAELQGINGAAEDFMSMEFIMDENMPGMVERVFERNGWKNTKGKFNDELRKSLADEASDPGPITFK